MARDYRPNVRESSVISRLDSAKEAARAKAINKLYEVGEDLANRVAMRLIEEKLIETKNKKELERQLAGCIKVLITSEDFDVQYQIAPLRSLVRRPNFISLYLTAFIIEKLINHRTIVDIYGTDEEIYQCVDSQVSRMIRV
jgi:hypothetical protein